MDRTINKYLADIMDASLIKKPLAKFDGITLQKNTGKRKTGLDEALDDVKAGRVSKYDSVDDFFKEMSV